jgi:hypothetical protein
MGSTPTDSSSPGMEGDFARRVIEVVNDAALALLMSIGSRS